VVKRRVRAYIAGRHRQEIAMTESNRAEWEKELQILLEQIRDHPSADLGRERARVTVLTKLLGEQAPAH
jgi:hypothetical protein